MFVQSTDRLIRAFGTLNAPVCNTPMIATTTVIMHQWLITFKFAHLHHCPFFFSCPPPSPPPSSSFSSFSSSPSFSSPSSATHQYTSHIEPLPGAHRYSISSLSPVKAALHTEVLQWLWVCGGYNQDWARETGASNAHFRQWSNICLQPILCHTNWTVFVGRGHSCLPPAVWWRPVD